MNIKFCKMDNQAIIPTKRDEDAAFDLYAITSDEHILKPNCSTKFYTGLKAIIPDDVWVLFKERSSTGSCGLSIRSGVIDSGYRGEWIVTMTNCSEYTMIFTDETTKPYFNEEEKTWHIGLGKAIAQFIVMPKLEVSSEEIDEASFSAAPKTLRGEGGWGSSGK
jgi:dUTP pyrophosphatase